MNQVVTRQQLEQQANRIPGASQATGIEQSRAVAEVQAAVAVAQRFPREEGRAMAAALEACGQQAMAERAFYSFPRGGQSVNGPSIALAVELARCWGNIDYGIMELERDDVAGHTEMLAFAWDLQTNTKSRQTFIVPHTRDTKSGAKKLTDTRDIYENNANNGARRLRECIFRVLPTYLREAAERECRKVLEKGDASVPLPERISRAIRSFAEIGVSLERLELRQGKSANWTPVDLANLHILHTSIKNRETTIEEAFPKEGVGDTAEQVRALAPITGKPARQTLEEALGDEIPDFDQRKVAEETAQAIDGPLEQEPQDSATVWLNGIRAQIGAATTMAAIDLADQEWIKNRAVCDDPTAAEVDAEIAAARRRVREGGKGGEA